MLRISKLTDYALLILSQMARTPENILSTTVLAECLHLGTPTVSKVLKMLAEATLVNSTRGAEGGYQLARMPCHITVADVITAMEGELALTECCESMSLCNIDAVCLQKNNWRKINQMIGALLAKFTLADMLSPINER